MGCDIHVYCEFLRSGQWKSADHFMLDYNKSDEVYEVVPIYDDRWYELFGILAGVRSDTHVPIANPRGIPDDCCNTIKRDCEEWSTDGHSHSWLTYEEIVSRLKADCGEFDSYQVHVLYPLIEAMLKRMREIYFMFSEYEFDHPKVMRYANEFRIVFWFDS